MDTRVRPLQDDDGLLEIQEQFHPETGHGLRSLQQRHLAGGEGLVEEQHRLHQGITLCLLLPLPLLGVVPSENDRNGKIYYQSVI